MSSKKRAGIDVKASEPNEKKPKAVADEEAFLSDHEPPEESAEEEHDLSWRNGASFSDWKIVIRVTESGNKDNENNEIDGESGKEFIYNCHRNILATGPRRSEYFVRLFDNDGTFSEWHDNTSRIELHELEANAFPMFLDYMYKAGEKVEFDTQTATALYSLSLYFGTQRLLKATTKYCTQNIRHIKEDSHLLHVTDAQFWIDLMEYWLVRQGTCRFTGTSSLNHCIKLFLSFFRMHIVSPEEFKQLTITPKGALEWLVWNASSLETPAMKPVSFLIYSSVASMPLSTAPVVRRTSMMRVF